MSYPTPLQSFEVAIRQWEGTWEDSPVDSGNWAHCHDGSRKLIGTMYGVTPDAYALYLGIDPGTLTAATMQRDITLDVAAEIGMRGYYLAPRMQLLPWSPLVAIALDIGWTSGPSRAIRMLQGLVGAYPDGLAGPETAESVDRYLHTCDIATCCDNLTEKRRQFYMQISEPGTTNARFRNGWLNRADWFLSTNTSPCWWDAWRGWRPTAPVGSSRPLA